MASKSLDGTIAAIVAGRVAHAPRDPFDGP
jgi:hypothetical protein